MKPCLYILYSTNLNRYYIGSTTDITRRLQEHASKHTHTTRKGSYKLVFQQEFKSLALARKAELKLKRWKRRDLLEDIIRDGKMKSV